MNRVFTTLGISWLLALAMVCVQACLAMAEQAYWELAPYRIRALVAIDAPGVLAEQLAEELPQYLADRAHTAFGPAWALDTAIARGPLRHKMLRSMESLTEPDLGELPPATDKVLLLVVRATPAGYKLEGREYDCYVQRWSATTERLCRQTAALPEQLFQLARETVSTLVQLQLDQENDKRVFLIPRGVDLPGKSVDLRWVKPGQVFVPIWRRTTREGELVKNGIQQVPWTFLEAEDSPDGPATARIYSGTRRPLGVRQRGRIEQLGILLPADTGETVVQLHSRTNPNKRLVGYEVYAQNSGEQSTRLIGRSDREGQIVVGPGDTNVQLLYVKSGGQILARVPVVSGAEPEVRIPLPDDDLRLEVEARLGALREDLVDVVARRNILLSRAEQEIEDNNLDRARQLLTQLDQLPNRAHFNRALSTEARQYHSDDPAVQKRIEELFAATQVVLAEFLDVRAISKLQDELRKAQEQGS